MECSVCDLRGAVQACSECHAQLCEVCSINCRRCGKPLCPAHAHKTHSGRLLCPGCLEERKAKKEMAKAMAEQRFEEEDMLLEQAQARPAVEEERVLTASARNNVPPWKLSLYTAGLGLVIVVVLLVLPTLRQVPLPGGSVIPTPYILMIIPLSALFWAGVGLLNEEYAEERSQALAGLAVGLLTAVLMVVAVVTDPARKAAREAAEAQMVRVKMTPQQLENWRKERLERFRH